MTQQQELNLERYTLDVEHQLESNQKRLAHSKRVSVCAGELAQIYGGDVYLAKVAGILHDWDKVTPMDELCRAVEDYKLDLGVDPYTFTGIQPILHGLIAAQHLPARYPEIDPAVWHAIYAHTTLCKNPSLLDCLLYVADYIEPGRKENPVRSAVLTRIGKDDLAEIAFDIAGATLEYLQSQGREIWPYTFEIYESRAIHAPMPPKEPK